MKKSLLALAVLGAYVGTASAQSSVTLYGTLDMAGRYVKADGQSRNLSLATNGIASSQLGFRGVEDLGGGLKAGFTLLGDLVGIDSGNVGSRFFGRRSTVSLLGGFGEIRLGRDYTPTFWNQTIFDAFGTNGLGNSTNVRQMYAGTRQDNTIGYLLPAMMGGLYGQVMLGAAERGNSGDRPARYVGGRVGFAAGPFDVAVAASEERFAGPFVTGSVGLTGVAGSATANANPTPLAARTGDEQRTYNVGASYDLGFLKVMGYVNQERLRGQREDMASVSVSMPIGQSVIRAGYDRSRLRLVTGGDRSVDQIKATYQYNLSKRTAVYATASRLDNKDATRLTLPGAAGQTTTSGDSIGAEFGVRHFF